MDPPPSPGQANFTLMTECTPESRRYYSVYSVVPALPLFKMDIYKPWTRTLEAGANSLEKN